MNRLFVALRPPAAVRDALLDATEGVERARWQDEDQLHLTLRFVGEVDAPIANDLAAALGQVDAAPFDLLDYVCIGGVFETSSKDNKEPPVRPEGFAALAAYARSKAPNMPVGAIAGIDESNAADVVAAGADGIAVISALSLASDPAQAASRLRAIVDRGLAMRGAA